MHTTKNLHSKKSQCPFFLSQASLTVTHKTEKKKKTGLNWHAPAATIRHILIILKAKRGIRASDFFYGRSDLTYHAIFSHVHPIWLPTFLLHLSKRHGNKLPLFRSSFYKYEAREWKHRRE